MSRRLLDQQPDRGAGARLVHKLTGRTVLCGFRGAHITASMSLPRVTCAACLEIAAQADEVLRRMEAGR